ncbi:MAG: hypothetical protein OXE85_10510 [Roseovarius sp.]|nr:hypothetical protein [Roseovarius sp.]
MTGRRIRQAEALNHPFNGDLINHFDINGTAHYWQFPPDCIKELSIEHPE